LFGTDKWVTCRQDVPHSIFRTPKSFSLVKEKFTREQATKVQNWIVVQLYFFFNLGGLSASRPGRFATWNGTRHPLYKKLGGPQCRSGRLRKSSPSTGIRSPDRPAHSLHFFFFHWHYSPLWALACRTRSFHFFLSITNSLHHC
jgi:hypothetical protein